ncbi:MAG TPA: sigma-70 family RNA polymerase sigma factor [Actinomycetota bacterium]|jgi:RNA polymerase sigma-70 factor (sigma-E family)|nr:sigma-70 family RNA polymerase sigma factor [Actinomycetota bacterium]
MERTAENVFDRPVSGEGRDGRTMDRLYEAHAQSAIRFAYFLLGDPEEAQDVVQEAFARALARWTPLRDGSGFSAYLHQTILNLVRKRAARRKIEQRWARNQRPQEPAWLPDVEQQDALWKALQRLPHRQKAALVLRFYSDLSESDTAEAMKCSPRAVNSLVNRGLASLRSGLPDEHR